MFLILQSLGWLIGLVSLKIWAFALNILTFVAFDLLRIRRSVSISNLEQALPGLSPGQRLRLARQSYFNFGMTVIELLGSSRFFKKSLQMEIRQGHILSHALSGGKGAYVLCVHLGNWEYMCSKGTEHFAKVSILAKDIGKGVVARFVTQLRKNNGCFVIPRNETKSATQKIHECLGRNEIVGFMVDQSRPGSPRVPLFGKGALTNVGLLQLYMRRPAPIIPIVSFRTKNGQHQMIFLPELLIERPDGMKFKETILHNALIMNRVVESMILTCPEQYFWMHRRWK